MTRFISLLFAAAFLLQSCQKDFQFVDQPDKQCRLSKMVWVDDSISTLVFSFHYDELNRIKSIAQAPEGDSVIAYYDGNSTKLIKLRFMSGATIQQEAEFVYNNNNQLSEIKTPAYHASMFYKDGRLDSAHLFNIAAQNVPYQEVHRNSKFFYNPNSSATSYRFTSDHVLDSSVIEYTSFPNPFPELALFNVDDFLRLDNLFPLSVYGHSDKHLVKIETVQLINITYSTYAGIPDYVRYEYGYEFDEKNKLKAAATRLFFNEIDFSPLNYQFYYGCK